MLENESLVRLLGERSRAVPAASFARDDEVTAGCGLYAWWGDEPACALITAVLDAPTPSLLYVGQAGGGASSRSLWTRVAGNHIGGNPRSSTFRPTVTALLAATAAGDVAPPDDRTVTDWIKTHLSVAVVAVSDRADVPALEEAALREYDPPLNLQGMPSTPARRRLSALRRRLGVLADGQQPCYW